MDVAYHAIFKFKYAEERGKEELSLTRILPDGSLDTSPVNLDEIYQLEELS